MWYRAVETFSKHIPINKNKAFKTFFTLSKKITDTGTCIADQLLIREIKSHVYAKRQTSDSCWEFLRIENKQIKIVQSNSLCIKLEWHYLFFELK